MDVSAPLTIPTKAASVVLAQTSLAAHSRDSAFEQSISTFNYEFPKRVCPKEDFSRELANMLYLPYTKGASY